MSWRKERRFQRIRDISVASTVEVLWSKYRWHCEEPACPRLSFYDFIAQVPRRVRSAGRLRDHIVDAVISSGRAVSETAAAFAVSWWTVRAALTEACLLTLPDVDELSPRMSSWPVPWPWLLPMRELLSVPRRVPMTGPGAVNL